MPWRCRECGRTYQEPPEACVCGSADLDPADGEGPEEGRYSLLAIRQRLLDPENADRSLVREEPYVAIAFRLLLAVTLVVLVLLAVVLLV